jgi:dimethylamine monooxygenase subunit A
MIPDGAPAPYLPFAGGHHRLTMGLMSLVEEDWLEIDSHLASDLAAKRHLLESRFDDVFAALPEATAPAEELLGMLADHLCHHHAAIFRCADNRLHVAATGDTWELPPPNLHPLDLAGRMVQEDFCLLSAIDRTYRLIGATLCSPARWRLADKIGKPLAAIHAPVPGYEARLEQPVDRFFALLKSHKPVWRLNWGIFDDPAPFQPSASPASTGVMAANAGERLWLRVERQTLRRLPRTGAVVFSIRTHIRRVDHAVRAGGAAADLASAIRDMDEATRRYKRIDAIADALLAWLAPRSSP